jgi:hypothetical protein
MKISQVMGLAVIALGVVAAVKAAEYAPVPAPVSRDVTWTPADAGTPVDVEAQSTRTIELSPVVIRARLPRKAVRQNAQCGAFAFRALEQGSGNVRGFCGGAL